MAEKQRFTVVEEVLWTVDAVGTTEALDLVRDGVTPGQALVKAHYRADVTDRVADGVDEDEIEEDPEWWALKSLTGEIGRHEVFERCEWEVDADSAEAAYVLVRDGVGVSKELEDAHFGAEVQERYVAGYPDVDDDTVAKYEMNLFQASESALV
jgi:hypothetical protein